MFIKTISSSSSAGRNTSLAQRRVEFSVTQTEDLNSPHQESLSQKLGVCLAANDKLVYSQLTKFIEEISDDEPLTDWHLSEMGRIIASASEMEISRKSIYKPKSKSQAVLKDWSPSHEQKIQEMAEELQGKSFSYLMLTLETSKNTNKRSAAVRAIALKHADGICESCGNPAPFRSRNGLPYLEGHHVRFLSQGGLDAPENVTAICPNCHREAHFCKDVVGFTRRLELVLRKRTSI